MGDTVEVRVSIYFGFLGVVAHHFKTSSSLSRFFFKFYLKSERVSPVSKRIKYYNSSIFVFKIVFFNATKAS